MWPSALFHFILYKGHWTGWLAVSLELTKHCYVTQCIFTKCDKTPCLRLRCIVLIDIFSFENYCNTFMCVLYKSTRSALFFRIKPITFLIVPTLEISSFFYSWYNFVFHFIVSHLIEFLRNFLTSFFLVIIDCISRVIECCWPISSWYDPFNFFLSIEFEFLIAIIFQYPRERESERDENSRLI